MSNNENTIAYEVLMEDLVDRKIALENNMQALKDALEWVERDLVEIKSLEAKLKELS